jgi:hypothetical protein
MSSRTDELRAQLELAEAEEAWVAAKASVNTPEVLKAREKVRKARAELRDLLADAPDLTEPRRRVQEARAAHRAKREAAAPQPEEVSE